MRYRQDYKILRIINYKKSSIHLVNSVILSNRKLAMTLFTLAAGDAALMRGGFHFASDSLCHSLIEN